MSFKFNSGVKIMIKELKLKMDNLQNEMKRDYKYYLNKHREMIKRIKENEIEVAKRIKEKMDAKYFVEFNITRDKYIQALAEKNEEEKLIEKKEKLIKNRKEQENKIKEKIKLEIDDEKIKVICNILKQKEENLYSNKTNKFITQKEITVQRYSFTKENISIYFYKENDKIIATKQGKVILNLLRNSLDLKKIISGFVNGIAGDRQLDLYIILKNKKMFKYMLICYYDNRLFFNDFGQNRNILKGILNEEYALGGVLLLQDEKPITFDISVTHEINYTNFKEEEIKEVIDFFADLCRKNNYKKDISKLKKQLKQKFKEASVFISIIYNQKINETYYITYGSEDVCQFLKIKMEENENDIKVKNIITEGEMKFNDLEEINLIFDGKDTIKDMLYKERIEVKQEKINIMIVGGNWSESSKKEVLKEYNATFISLEEYERYSEKSKNMDYIFIDTSANTHSNTYKAKSIHDNVKLISRSKKEEIDKWVK